MNKEDIKPVDPEQYKKEFAILDSLYGKFDFSIFEDPVFNESRLFTVLAWCIERLKLISENWEEDINAFIENVFKIDDLFDRYLYMEKYFLPMEIEYFKHIHNGGFNVELRQSILGWIDKRYEKEKKQYADKNEKMKICLSGMPPCFIPTWYWTWFNGHELEKKVKAANRRNFVNNMRQVMNKNGRSDEEDD